MITGPFDVAPIVSRLAASVPDFLQVGTAADIAVAQASQAPSPCAFVMLAAEQGEQRAGGFDAYRQRVTATIGVLIGVRAFGDETGGVSSPALVSLLTKTRTALIGWQPALALTQIEYADGRILAMDADATVWWLERYRLDYWISSP